MQIYIYKYSKTNISHCINIHFQKVRCNNYSCHGPGVSIAILTAAAAAKSLQSCPTPCNPIDGSPRGSLPWDSPGKNNRVGCRFLLQCMKVKVKSLSHARLLATPWTAAYQAPLPMGFSRQDYCYLIYISNIFKLAKHDLILSLGIWRIVVYPGLLYFWTHDKNIGKDLSPNKR